MSKFEKYREGIKALEQTAEEFDLRLSHDVNPSAFKGIATDEELVKLQHPNQQYELWYSKAISVVDQLLPARADDFAAFYKPIRARKDVYASNYTISDYLRGTRVLDDGRYKGPELVLTLIRSQKSIITALLERLDSVLYDIRLIEHADLLDDEVSAAEELNKKGFVRGAGAVAGVALESHLKSVCGQHPTIKLKSKPTIADYNDALKNASVYDVATWRFIQHLGDIRNKCDHKKADEPTNAEVSDLIAGVRKIIKTVF